MMSNKILFLARDPGGANAIVPIILSLNEKFNVAVIAREYAKDIFEKNGIAYELIQGEISKNTIREVLEETAPQLIITGTSADDFLEKYAWLAAKELNIKSIAILDQWVNYGVRFSEYSLCDIERFEADHKMAYLPDYICVMDEIAKQGAKADGIPESIIRITGQPYLEIFKDQLLHISRDRIMEIRDFYGVKDEDKLVVFASEDISKTYDDDIDNPYWGYNEKTIFPKIVNALKEIKLFDSKIQVVIRPHPKEEIEYWKRYAKDNNYDCIIDNSLESKEVIVASDLIIGMQSMFLLEAVLAEKPVMSVQIGLKRKNPLVLCKLGIVQTVYDEKELYGCIEDQIMRPCKFKWNVADNAIRKVCDLVEEII